MAGADQVAASAFDAVGKSELPQLLFIIGARVPEQLLRQKLDRADGCAITAANAGKFAQNV